MTVVPRGVSPTPRSPLAMIFAPKLWGLSANSSCTCGNCNVNSSVSGPHVVTHLLLLLPSPPATQLKMLHLPALHLLFPIPVQLRKVPLMPTPRQNSGLATCWGPWDFQSLQSPTAADIFFLPIYVFSLSQQTAGSRGWRRPSLPCLLLYPQNSTFICFYLQKERKEKNVYKALSVYLACIRSWVKQHQSTHFTDEETEAHGRYLTSPRLHSWSTYTV